MNLGRRLMAVLATGLVSAGAGAFAATTPAQAALGDCPLFGAKGFCLYETTSYSGLAEFDAGDLPRNTCIPTVFNVYNSVWNATGTRWFLFRTTRCDGSHAEIAPGFAGRLPSGYDGGRTVAIMRTSTTS
jgi:hypothetical protein